MEFTHLKSTVLKPLNKLVMTSALVLGLSSSALAGNILITGYDADDYSASNYMNWGLTYLLTGNGSVVPAAPTSKIGFIGNTSATLVSYLGNYNNFQFYDLDVATWTKPSQTVMTYLSLDPA